MSKRLEFTNGPDSYDLTHSFFGYSQCRINDTDFKVTLLKRNDKIVMFRGFTENKKIIGWVNVDQHHAEFRRGHYEIRPV